MPHIPEHTYVIAGTNEKYSGRVIMIGGDPFTTVDGGIEGNNQKLEDSQQNQTTTNPVTRTFVSRVVYYRQDGSEVPIGSDLHEHQRGQIMLGHDPNNMGAIVTRIRPKGFGDDLGLDGFEPSNMGGNTSRVTNPNPTTSGNTGTNPGGMGGRRRTSGGGGGGY